MHWPLNLKCRRYLDAWCAYVEKLPQVWSVVCNRTHAFYRNARCRQFFGVVTPWTTREDAMQWVVPEDRECLNDIGSMVRRCGTGGGCVRVMVHDELWWMKVLGKTRKCTRCRRQCGVTVACADFFKLAASLAVSWASCLDSLRGFLA